MIRVRKIAHASYEVPDVEQQTDYYTNILGMKLVATEKDTTFLANTIDHHSVVLHKGSYAQCLRIGFQIGEGDDLDERARRTRRAVLVLDHPAGRGLAGGGNRGVA